MPHIIVKLWPGKAEEQKIRLAERITKDVRPFSTTAKNRFRSASKKSNHRIGRRRFTSQTYLTARGSYTRNPDIIGKGGNHERSYSLWSPRAGAPLLAQADRSRVETEDQPRGFDLTLPLDQVADGLPRDGRAPRNQGAAAAVSQGELTWYA